MMAFLYVIGTRLLKQMVWRSLWSWRCRTSPPGLIDSTGLLLVPCRFQWSYDCRHFRRWSSHEGTISFLDIVVGRFVFPTQSFEGTIEDVVFVSGCCLFKISCHLIPVWLSFLFPPQSDISIKLAVTSWPTLPAFVSPPAPSTLLWLCLTTDEHAHGFGAFYYGTWNAFLFFIYIIQHCQSYKTVG